MKLLGTIALATMPSVALAQAYQSFTLGDMVARLQDAAHQANLAATKPQANRALDSLADLVVQMHAGGLTPGEVAELVTRRRAGFASVLRWSPDRYAVFAQPWFRTTVVGLQQIANTSLAPLLVAPSFTPAGADSVLAPVDSLERALLRLGIAANKEKLRRYEIKYGPNSPRLNIVEAALNYAGQLFIPGLLPSEDGWPTPFEIVATYRTSDLTAAEAASGHLTGRVVSTGQLGLRMYSFAQTCGVGRFADLLQPCESSLGLFIMGPRDAPLLRTWGRDSRAGAYLSRGSYHLGVVFGNQNRVVIGSGKQILPYAF